MQADCVSYGYEMKSGSTEEKTVTQTTVMVLSNRPREIRHECEILDQAGFSLTFRFFDVTDPHLSRLPEPCLVLLHFDTITTEISNTFVTIKSQYLGPIIALSASENTTNDALLLESGADDHLALPVDPRIFLARIRALLRRSYIKSLLPSKEITTTENIPPQQGCIDLGKLIVDAGSRSAKLHGTKINLTSAEFELLWFLAKKPGQTVTREDIYPVLRGIPYDGVDRSIDLRVARLRKKLGDDGRTPQLIKSIRSTGYMMTERVE